MENLYFSYLFMLRAAMKAAPILAAAHYDTGNPVEDADTRDIMTRCVRAGWLGLLSAVGGPDGCHAACRPR